MKNPKCEQSQPLLSGNASAGVIIREPLDSCDDKDP